MVEIQQMIVKARVNDEFDETDQELIKLIDDLDIKSNVILKSDFIDESDVKNYFCASDMITQTYHTATQSGVTQIAYHFERPMLVTNVGGLSEIVMHNKVGYVTKKDPQDIADYILEFYSKKTYNILFHSVLQVHTYKIFGSRHADAICNFM